MTTSDTYAYDRSTDGLFACLFKISAILTLLQGLVLLFLATLGVSERFRLFGQLLGHSGVRNPSDLLVPYAGCGFLGAILGGLGALPIGQFFANTCFMALALITSTVLLILGFLVWRLSLGKRDTVVRAANEICQNEQQTAQVWRCPAVGATTTATTSTKASVVFVSSTHSAMSSTVSTASSAALGTSVSAGPAQASAGLTTAATTTTLAAATGRLRRLQQGFGASGQGAFEPSSAAGGNSAARSLLAMQRKKNQTKVALKNASNVTASAMKSSSTAKSASATKTVAAPIIVQTTITGLKFDSLTPAHKTALKDKGAETFATSFGVKKSQVSVALTKGSVVMTATVQPNPGQLTNRDAVPTSAAIVSAVKAVPNIATAKELGVAIGATAVLKATTTTRTTTTRELDNALVGVVATTASTSSPSKPSMVVQNPGSQNAAPGVVTQSLLTTVQPQTTPQPLNFTVTEADGLHHLAAIALLKRLDGHENFRCDDLRLLCQPPIDFSEATSCVCSNASSTGSYCKKWWTAIKHEGEEEPWCLVAHRNTCTGQILKVSETQMFGSSGPCTSLVNSRSQVALDGFSALHIACLSASVMGLTLLLLSWTAMALRVKSPVRQAAVSPNQEEPARTDEGVSFLRMDSVESEAEHTRLLRATSLGEGGL